MTAQELHDTLTTDGFRLSVKDGKLMVGNGSSLTAEQRAAVSEQKDAIIKLLEAREDDFRAEADNMYDRCIAIVSGILYECRAERDAERIRQAFQSLAKLYPRSPAAAPV